MLTQTQITNAARSLIEAERLGTAVPKLSQVYPDIQLAEAYQISAATAEARISSGGVVKGHKIGLTSLAMQRSAGIDEPDYGFLFADTFVPESSVVPAGRLIRPFVEAELAFVLKTPLEGPWVTVADVIRATDFVVPALEVPDTRFLDEGAPHIADTIADNASTGLVILGSTPRHLHEIDVRGVGVTLSINGILRSSGVSATVMGSPLNSMAWLANKLSEFGTCLEAGQVVLSGSFIAMSRVRPGDQVAADFGALGTVSFSVSAA